MKLKNLKVVLYQKQSSVFVTFDHKTVLQKLQVSVQLEGFAFGSGASLLVRPAQSTLVKNDQLQSIIISNNKLISLVKFKNVLQPSLLINTFR